MTPHTQLLLSEGDETPYVVLTRFLVDAELDDLIAGAPVLCRFIPALEETVNFNQHSPHHAYDVYTHICHVTAAVPREATLRWAALLHDVGKPACFAQDETGRGHFKGHAQVGAAMAAEILRELDAPKPFAAEVVWLIDHHMEPLPRNEAELSADVERDGLTRTRQLLILKEADARSKGVVEGQKDTLPHLQRLQEQLGNCMSASSASYK
jgi:tRNA nucleotidyltransferase (CCA-adding enzyme)